MADLSKEQDKQEEFKPEGVLINNYLCSIENKNKKGND